METNLNFNKIVVRVSVTNWFTKLKDEYYSNFLYFIKKKEEITEFLLKSKYVDNILIRKKQWKR